MLAILTFQSKQHAPFAEGPRSAPGVTLLTPGLWHLFRTLQRLTLGVTAVIEKLSRHVLPRGPSLDHLVEPAPVTEAGMHDRALSCAGVIMYKAVNYCVATQQDVIFLS